MKKAIIFICLLSFTLPLLLCGCSRKNKDKDEGFYAKTPAKDGLKAATEVIDIRTEKKRYEGEGDLLIDATVGFGYSADSARGEGAGALKVEYFVFASPVGEDGRPAWEMTTDYQFPFYDEMLCAEEKEGELTPKFNDEIELIFPAAVEKGHLQIRLCIVSPEGDKAELSRLEVYFEREDGVLTLAP